jgi:hypothetical protein
MHWGFPPNTTRENPVGEGNALTLSVLLGQSAASGTFLYGQRSAVDGGKRMAHCKSQNNPLFQDFLQFLATGFQRASLRPHAL